MVNIQVKLGGKVYSCGGSIIGSKYVLTAAHCVAASTPDDPEVVVGAHNLTEGVHVAASKITVPENYDLEKGMQYDIAVIELREALKFSKKVSPICIAESDHEPFDMMKIAGWGRFGENKKSSETLQETEVQYVDEWTCYLAKYWFLVKLHGLNPKKQHEIPDLHENHMCARNHWNGGDACSGDTGGPLMYQSPATFKYFAVGVTSGGLDPCGNPRTPSFYTKVKNFREFIRQHAHDICLQPYDYDEI